MPIGSLLVSRRVQLTVGLLILAALLFGVLALLAFAGHLSGQIGAPRLDPLELSPFRWEHLPSNLA
jgi:hypothetical protein